MATYYDSSGKPYKLDTEIGRGGEGTVYYCLENPALVAKIYHEAIDEGKAEKLRWMAANKNDQLLKTSAWVSDTLHKNPDGEVVGFLMPNVRAKEIHELYSLKSRKVHFPDATWQFLIHTATNVARAFYSLHRNDHIMGDVNHGNCVVLADGTVKLIDCDSYSIKTDKMRYRCEVGVATHLAPELQGIDLSKVDREKNHDNFGLAVIIFQMLFLGRHPFAGNYLGAEDKSLEDCIRERRFAYGNQTLTNVKQPPGTLSLSQIPFRLEAMFYRAFITVDRPEPHEWIEALEDLSDNLKQCLTHIGHHYYNGIDICPWCGIEAKTGLMLFPFISSDKDKQEDNFNVFTIENLLKGLDIPKNLPAILPKAIIPSPSWEATELRKERLFKFTLIACVQILAFFIFVSFFAPTTAFFLCLFSLLGIWAYVKSLTKNDTEFLKISYQSNINQWNQLESEWQNNNERKKLNDELSNIRQKINEHQELQNKKRQLIKTLDEESQNAQVERYLAKFPLTDFIADKKKLDILTWFGIKTAANIEESRFTSLLAIDKGTKMALLDWRKELEKGSQYVPVEKLREEVSKDFEFRFAGVRRKLETEIGEVISSLRKKSTTLNQYQKNWTKKSEELAKQISQTESDLTTLKHDEILSLVFIAIALVVPSLSFLYQVRSPSPSKVRQVVKNDDQVKSVGVSYSSNENFYVNENITDKEIGQMSDDERQKSARALHIQARELISIDDDKQAEKKLLLALRFTNHFESIYQTLGELLYRKGSYKESIKVLENGSSIFLENEPRMTLIGQNYLKLGNNKKAKEILVKAVAINPASFEANFNLGKAHQNLKDYQSAKNSLMEAINLKSTDVEAIYEYGVTLNKEGLKDEAQEVYESLLRLDIKKANELGRLLGIKEVNYEYLRRRQ